MSKLSIPIPKYKMNLVSTKGTRRYSVFWEFAQNCMHRLAAQSLQPSAILEDWIFSWLWELLMILVGFGKSRFVLPLELEVVIVWKHWWWYVETRGVNSMIWMGRECHYNTVGVAMWVGNKCCINCYGISHNKVLLE